MAEHTEQEQAWRDYIRNTYQIRVGSRSHVSYECFQAGWEAAKHLYTTKIGTNEHRCKQAKSD